MSQTGVIPPESVEPDLWHRLTLFAENASDATIDVTATFFGAPVDLINNAPLLANFIPGVDGVGPMSDKPFLGRDSLHDMLDGGHNLLIDATGTYDPEPQDALDHAIAAGGYASGAVLSGGLLAQGYAVAAAPQLTSSIAGALNAATPAAQVAGNVAGGTAKAAWWAVTHPGTVLMGTGALAAADVVFNNARLSGPAAGTALEAVLDKAVDMAGDAITAYAPQPVRKALSGAHDFLSDNPDIAKWGSFGLAWLLTNGIASLFTGNNPLMQVAAMAVTGFLAWHVSEHVKSGLGAGADNGADTGAENTPQAQGPVRMAAPAPA